VSDVRTSPPAGDGQSGPGRTDDPMSADRRVLAIAAASMVGLVLLGVVSAQLFTRSACTRIDPDPVTDRSVALAAPAVAGEGVPDVEAVAAEALPDLADGDREQVTAAIAGLEEALGPLASVADVRGAERLQPVGDGLAAVGPTTTVLDADGSAVRSTVDLDEGTVVGSGSSLFSLALVNQLTGQVDALQALDPSLQAGRCVDTATVGTPLAFHLDASGGELLLFRTEEDGDEPAVELRAPVAGSVWSTALPVGTAPAGVLAERVTGRLGTDTVVAGWRTLPDHDGDAIAALDREDGEIRWTAAAADLRDAVRAGHQRPTWIDVLAVGEDEVVVAIVLEPEDAGDDERWPGIGVVALGLDDGELRWHARPGGSPVTFAVEGPEGWAVANAGDGQFVVSILDVRGELLGQYLTEGASGAGPGAVAPAGSVLGDGTVAVAAGPLLLRGDDTPGGAVGGPHAHGVAAEVAFVDVLELGDRVHVLARSGEGALLLSFFPDRDADG
jgi:outer membrane protein assembly factor BamB